VLFEEEVKSLNHLLFKCLSPHTYEITIGSILGYSNGQEWHSSKQKGP